MIDGDLFQLAERAVIALERIANHIAPADPPRERREAVLSTATYRREDQDKKGFEDFGKAAKPKG